jgi:hypothetical protein
VTRTFTARARTLIGCTATFGVAAAGLTALPAAAATVTPFISEIHYDNAGTDVGEAIEVQAAAGTDLTGWTLVRYNGNVPTAATVYTAPAPSQLLGGVVPSGDPSGDGVRVETYPANGLQNDTEAVALVDPQGAVVEFLSWEGVVTASSAAAGGPAAGLTSTDIGVREDPAPAAGSSLQKVGGVWVVAATSSFGTVNGGGTDPEPGARARPVRRDPDVDHRRRPGQRGGQRRERHPGDAPGRGHLGHAQPRRLHHPGRRGRRRRHLRRRLRAVRHRRRPR